MFLSVSQKINQLTHTLLYCIRSLVHPLPTCAKKSRSATAVGLVVLDMHLETPQLKSMGNIPFGQFSVTKPQTPNPVILHQFVAAWPCYFWRKIQTFFPNPNFARVRYVRTHATEISQLKFNGESCFCLYLKNKPVNPYPVILYKIMGSPPPHLCQKIRVRRCGRIGRPWHQVAIHASGNPPTKINGKYSFWPILCH